MAKCGNCGAEGARIRSRWRGTSQLPDECPNCAPQTFERVQMPSDQKIWMGYEAHPNEYVKGSDGGFDRKPEYRAEQEDKLALGDADDRAMQEQAEAHKRATRRKEPMDSIELEVALRKARIISDALEAANAEEQKLAAQAELDSWVSRAKQA